MAKTDTTKIILIAGGIGLGAYLLTNKNIAEQIKNALTGIAGGGGGFPNIEFPAISFPPFNIALPQLPQLDSCNLSDLFGSMANKGTGGGSSQLPAGGATVTDVVYSMPSWAKGVIGVSAGIVGGYGGYQIARYSAPALRTLGNVAAKSLGGIAGFLGRIFGTTGTAITSKLATILGRGGQAGMVEIGALSSLGGIANAISIFPTLLTLSGTDPVAQRQWAAQAQAQGGTPATVAPNIAPVLPSMTVSSVWATRTTPLRYIPTASGLNITQATGWRQVRQTPSVTIAGKTYGIFTSPNAPAPPKFTPVGP